MTARMFLIVRDAALNRLGDGPVANVTGFTYRRQLDGVGTATIRVSAANFRAASLLQPRRLVTLQHDPLGESQFGSTSYGDFLILKVDFKASASGDEYVLTCADAAIRAKDVTTLFGKRYRGVGMLTVLTDLQALLTPVGVTLVYDFLEMNLLTLNARFDGISVYEAIAQICAVLKIHFVTSGTSLSLGAFGTFLNGISPVLMNAEDAPQGWVASNSTNFFWPIDTFSYAREAEDLCNWILPIGAGTNQQALKLKRSTRVSPYTIQTATGPNGKPYWYLSDAASIAANGTIQRVIQWPEIVPVENSTAGRVDAANQLYDAAVAYLQRHKDPLSEFSVTIKEMRGNVPAPLLGYQARVKYVGNVMDINGVTGNYVDVDDFFIVTGINLSIGLDGYNYALDLSSTDMMPENPTARIVSSIKTNNIRGTTVSVVPNLRSWHYEGNISSSIQTFARVEITDATVEVERVLMRLRHGVYLQALTTGLTGDSVTPTNIRININGVDRTAALGGPWSGTGTALLDITTYIVDDPGGLYMQHPIIVSCDSGRGRIQLYFEILETITGVEVT